MEHTISTIDLRTLIDHVDKDSAALIYNGRTVTYSWLYDTSRKLAQGLAGVLRPGQPVAIWLHNSPELIALYLACLRCGVIPMPLRHEMRQAEVSRALDASNARILVSSSRLMSTMDRGFYQKLKRIFTIDDGQICPPLESWKLLLEDGTPRPPPELNLDKKTPAFILPTSGSEGKPKFVVLSVENLEQILAYRRRVTGLDSLSIAVTGSCLTQSVGLHQVLAMLSAGGLVVLFEGYNIDLMAEAINRHRATHLIMVVSAFNQLLDHPDITSNSFSSIRFASVGADKVTTGVQNKYSELTNQPLTVTYGLTESSWALVNDSGRMDKALSIGKADNSVEVRLVDEDGKGRGNNEIGEIQVKSPRTMLGYLNEPLLTDAVLNDGWLSSGDLATRDDEGFYWFAGRRKNQIVLSTGDTVSPLEIEQVLSEHGQVLECMVASGISAEDDSEVPVAYIVPECKILTQEALYEYLDESLSAYKHPREIYFVSALPTGSTGKVLRE